MTSPDGSGNGGGGDGGLIGAQRRQEVHGALYHGVQRG